MPTYTLTTDADTIAGTVADDTVNGTAATLTAGDSLAGDAGHDVLQLFGAGTFDLSALAQFSGFEEVNVTNIIGGQSNLTLRNGADLTVTIDNPSGGTVQLADGATTLNLSSGYAVSGSTGTSTINNSSYGVYSLSSGDATINSRGGIFNLSSGTVIVNSNDINFNNSYFHLSTGNATINVTNGNFNRYYLSAGEATITSGGVYWNEFHVSTGRATINATAYYENYVYVQDVGTIDYSSSFTANGYNTLYAEGAGHELDLTRLALGGSSWRLSLSSADMTVLVDQASLSHIRSIDGSANDHLQTAAAALDLTNAPVSGGITIGSSNATGTTFTVNDITTGLRVIGGTGTDTLVAQGFAFTSGQRAAIFAQGSVEVIQDINGTYSAPVAITSIEGGDNVINAVEAAGGITVSGFAETGATLTVNGASVVVDNSGQWTATVAAPSGDGPFDIVATVVRSAGTSTAIRTLTVDTAAPVVVITSAGGASNSATRTVTGTGEAGTTVQVLEGATVLGTALVAGNGTWSVSVTLAGEGAHNLTARAADAAGNVGTSAPVTYTLDTVAPPVAIATIEGGDTTVNAAEAAGGIVVSGTAEIGASLTVNGTAVTVNGTGAWTTTLTAPADGPFDVTAIATDAAGNTTTVTQTLAVDTVAPIVAITSAGGTVTAAAQTITGTGETGTTVEVRDGATVLGTALVAGDGTWSVSVTLAGDGAHSLTARDTDAAGNIGTSDAVGYTLNSTPANTAPTITSNGGGAAANLAVAENGTVVTTVVASDPELTAGTQTLTYAIVGGADRALLDIDSGTGALSFRAAPNFELPGDVGGNRVYEVTVEVSDGHGGTDTQAIAVTVTNASEPTVGGDALNYVINGSGNNQTVALTRTTITDGDLVTVANPSGTASPTYQWQFSSNGGTTWSNIAGATAATYTPTGVNLDRPVHLVATYTDVFGAHTVTSRAAEIGDRNNNTLQGTTAADLLIGLNGDDTYTVDNAGDLVVEASGGGNDTVRTSLAAYALDANVETLTFIGASTTASFAWTGNTLANTITAGGGADLLDGGAGNDTLNGAGGNDTLTGGAGNDTLNGGADNDAAVFSGTVADHTFKLSGSSIVIASTADGSDTLSNVENARFGSTTYRLVAGNSSDNTLSATAAADLILGFGGNDTVSYASSSGGVVASLADATQNAGDAAGDIYLSIRNLTGGGGSDRLIGDGANNALSGGGGSDTIEGGAGNDTSLTGGAQSDTFVFRSGFGRDRIADFDANPTGGQDFIELAGFGITAANFGAHVTIARTNGGADTLVTIDGNADQTIRLEGVVNTSVTVDDFRFA